MAVLIDLLYRMSYPRQHSWIHEPRCKCVYICIHLQVIRPASSTFAFDETLVHPAFDGRPSRHQAARPPRVRRPCVAFACDGEPSGPLRGPVRRATVAPPSQRWRHYIPCTMTNVVIGLHTQDVHIYKQKYTEDSSQMFECTEAQKGIKDGLKVAFL